MLGGKEGLEVASVSPAEQAGHRGLDAEVGQAGSDIEGLAAHADLHSLGAIDLAGAQFLNLDGVIEGGVQRDGEDLRQIANGGVSIDPGR